MKQNSSATLAKAARSGEPFVVLKIVGVGNAAPYDFRDKKNVSYLFQFNPEKEGHILRVPLHLWQKDNGRMAHDVLDQRLSHAIIVTLEEGTK